MTNINLYAYGRSRVQGKWYIAKNWVVSRIYYVNSGTARIWNSASEYVLEEGHLYIIPPCKNFEPLDADRFDHTYFDFYSARVLDPSRIIALDGAAPVVKAFFEYIHLLIHKDTDGRMHPALNHYLAGFLSVIEAEYPQNLYINNTTVSQALHIIYAEFSNITTSALAKKLNLDKSYFIRTFSSVMGISPMKYIRSFRVQYGKMLMQNGASVAEAARKCGYSSPSAFYNATKAELHTSPSKLKKN